MRKLIICFAALLFANAAKGQVFKPVKIDSLVTVSMPRDFTRKDTLNQQIFTGNGLAGYVMAIRQANKKGNQPLKREKDLKKVIKTYITGLQNETENGNVVNTRDTVVGKLEGKAFTLETTGDDGVTLRDFLLIYTQDATYTFEYVYPEFRKELVKPEIKMFFSSIKLSAGLQSNDQFLTRSDGLGLPALVGMIAGGVAVIALIIFLFVRNSRRTVNVEI